MDVILDWRLWVIKKNIVIFGKKISIIIKKEFIYNKKCLKTRIKFFGDEATDLHGEEMHKVGSNYISLAIILTNFVLKKWKLLSTSAFKRM